jgi:hypothetical protein
METKHSEKWYSSPGSMGQGLIIAESGRTVAVSYDGKDAPLLAAAPGMLETLENVRACLCLALEKGYTVHDLLHAAGWSEQVHTVMGAIDSAIHEAKGE